MGKSTNKRTSRPRVFMDPECPAEKRAEQDAYNRKRGAETRLKVLKSNLKRAKEQPATVYIALDENGSPLYVGQTTQLARRTTRHKYKSGWWPLHRELVTRHHDTVADALVDEYRLIEEHRPEWNELYEDDRYGQGY